MAKWLVTGGAGFIGSHIVDRLVSKGEKVRVLDNMFSGNKEYLASSIRKIDLMIGDIRDLKTVEKAVKGVDYVLHQAALRSVPRSVENPRDANSVNVEGTLNCLIASAKARVKRFVMASSSSVYGNSTQFPQKETALPSPVSPYAASKMAGEHYCNVFANLYGLSTVALRYFNVYGPRQDPKSKYAAVIPKFIISSIKGKPLEVHWDGKQSRDFTFVTSVANANILAARSRNLRKGVYNVACGDHTSLLEIISSLEKITGKKLMKKFSPRRRGDVRKTYADISAIRRDMKFSAGVNMGRGLKETYEFFIENGRWRKY